MKIGFVTCVQLGLSCMEAIYRSGAKLDLAVTLPDDISVNKSGRVYIDEFCRKHDVELVKVRHVNDEQAVQRFSQLDWLFIIGWSQIADDRVLDAPRFGVLGIHPTLLPAGRGRASIPWAILKRLDETGITLFKLDSGVDTGPIVAQRKIPMERDIDAATLYRRVCEAHSDLLTEVLPVLLASEPTMYPQDETRASNWPGRGPKDGEIDLEGTAIDAECLVRAVTRPYPGAFTVRNGKKLIVWRSELSSTKPEGDFLEFSDGYLALVETEIRE